ncbi:MAG: TetR family transcriptional regulator [Proteobacteria bacterium]|nr:TetR family transcriptional regulator [Pseudomonadota bacterium]
MKSAPRPGKSRSLRAPQPRRFKPREPGKLRQRQREDRVRLILEAARTVFVEDGHAAFSSRRVAAVAGLTLSTLQHYFATHQSLRLAAIDSLVGLYPARYRAMLHNGSLTARRRLELLVDDTLEAVSDPYVCGFIFQAFALAAHDPAVGRIVEGHYAEYVDVVAEMLRMHKPGLDRDRAAELATIFTSQMDGMMFFEFRGGTRIPAFSRLRPLLKARLMKLLDE